MSMYEPIPQERSEAAWAEDRRITAEYFYSPEHKEEPRLFPYLHEATIEMQSDFDEAVWDTLIEIFHMLIEKNRKYGDSALNPARIFSKADNTEQIKVRIDDKLNRIKNAQDDDTEDAVKDLTGYLILFMIARGF